MEVNCQNEAFWIGAKNSSCERKKEGGKKRLPRVEKNSSINGASSLMVDRGEKTIYMSFIQATV